jgi:hypothetical protein
MPHELVHAAPEIMAEGTIEQDNCGVRVVGEDRVIQCSCMLAVGDEMIIECLYREEKYSANVTVDALSVTVGTGDMLQDIASHGESLVAWNAEMCTLRVGESMGLHFGSSTVINDCGFTPLARSFNGIHVCVS